ncbi:hypothetical protein PDENDC454_05256 [Paenibacillus dendritiformis C454]|uniref:Uncharacterized protein n=1 Tax=Paenibacillus dendritiformis C454 TaxID=1131935 RepID=H3SC15_9BACL|nr:hypothetical protein PDENDC454_05256 [Paenibacillus dendritiformis C454]
MLHPVYTRKKKSLGIIPGLLPHMFDLQQKRSPTSTMPAELLFTGASGFNPSIIRIAVPRDRIRMEPGLQQPVDKPAVHIEEAVDKISDDNHGNNMPAAIYISTACA